MIKELIFEFFKPVSSRVEFDMTFFGHGLKFEKRTDPIDGSANLKKKQCD